MNPILQAMASGYGVNKILKYIASSNPQLATKISSAASFGYTANEILKYVMKGGRSLSSSLPNASKNDMTLYDKMQYSMPEGIENVAKVGLGLGAAGLGYLAGMAVEPNAPQQNAQAATQTAPSPLTNPPVPNAPQPAPIIPGNNIGQQINNQINQPTNPAQVATAAQAQPQQPQLATQIPGGQTQPTQSIFEQLIQGVDVESLDKSKKDQLKFLKDVSNQLQAKGKTIDDREFKKLNQNIQKTLKGKSGMLMEEATRGMSQPEQQPQKIEPKSIVSTPQGVGEVKGLSNGNAIVEIDGKAHKVSEKDIQQPPIPEKDLADLHNELIGGIEKSTGKQVSRNVNWAGYDPEAKELQYRPWSGDSYTFNDIEPEDVDMLTSFLTQRKTTGENFIGGWEEGTESPIGAAMHKLITKLKEKAKAKGVKEYTRKYQTVYSAYEPAEQAAKLKKKLAEQARKKREKDAKKAKK